ncbi:MAG TPA: hypothetical protein VKG24_14405 [Pseudolabrys sp.]|jgi:hypothetical protein|nr:hypothetical protein [Pseudolabrys sp.]
MNKLSVFSSLAAAALVAAIAVLATPHAQVKASNTPGVKSDTLPTQKFGPTCSQQAWPYYQDECVRDQRLPAGQILKVRLVSIAPL